MATIPFVWYGAFSLFFIYSGAQNILSDPSRQSSKFIKAFIETEPLPRMATDPFLVWKGVVLISLLQAVAFHVISPGLGGGWIRKGVVYGVLLWMIMIPWFEFYLPYNVMNEPMGLVLFEGFLWLCTLLVVGIYSSFVLWFKK